MGLMLVTLMTSTAKHTLATFGRMLGSIEYVNDTFAVCDPTSETAGVPTVVFPRSPS